jgi:hypothetical protein
MPHVRKMRKFIGEMKKNEEKFGGLKENIYFCRRIVIQT